jgi:hypothetical protein
MSRFDTLRIRRLLRSTMLPMLALLLVASACGRFHRGDDLDAGAAIVFENQSLDQADVFAVAGVGDAIRIGTVMPGQTQTLAVPANIVSMGQVNIVARLLARSLAPRTGPVSLTSGSRFRVTLPVDERTLVLLPYDR